ncbi:10769_t:CDS:2 [Dentiscutata erythropus]|uniref:10769_t:CDS:1 n=1 Tax=Dentiscutata erythropus TaxID=1348616 RepID=A0A9N8ZSK1_9GLOM|nr:10769_t:CDS:2 [Dentiscutata erythropus]
MSSNIKKPISSRTSKVVATADSYFQYAKEIVISRSWEPLLHFAQNTILSLMSKIDYGYLRVLSPDCIYEFGPKDSTLRVNIKIINDSFWGFAEAYMIGDVTCDDLPTLIKMFASFLSSDMTYSSAVFESENDTLEDAQYRKLRMIIKKAKICKDDHLLEIGSGWGSLAIEQKNLAEERIAKAGLSSNIEVLLCDYRNLPASHQYDKIISIEMIEAVGPEYLTTYFECCDKFLKEQGGIGVFQVITMPETRYSRYCREVDFIRKYIFPGGHCPTVTTLVQAINKGSRGRLIVDDIENIGPHYARTLKLWRLKFLEVFEEHIRPALIRNWPEMKNDEIEIFKRKWEFYFAYCEGGFVCRILGNVQVVITREGNEAFLEGIPL